MLTRRDRRSVLQEHKGKGKSVPLQAWTGPEGYRRLELTDSRQSTHEGGNIVSPISPYKPTKCHNPKEHNPKTHSHRNLVCLQITCI